MDYHLWLFVLNKSEGGVPYPWERCYDVTDEILYYKNIVNKKMVIDLRREVNLGGGMVHCNRKKRAIKGHFSELLDQQDLPVTILADCCGPQVFFLVPEIVQRCPMCEIPVIYIPLFG